MSRDNSDDLLPRNVPKPPPLIEATPKPSVPEVSLLFDQGKSSTVLSQPNPPRVKSSLPGISTGYDQSKSNTVSPQPYPLNIRSQEVCNSRYSEKEEIPVINRQTESYNVWRSRNTNLIYSSKGRVGQSYEPHVQGNYNHHNKAKQTADRNVVSAGSSQTRGVYNGQAVHRIEEANGVISIDNSNRGYYTVHGPKELSSVSNVEYVTQLNKYNDVPVSSGKYSDAHLPNNEHTSLHTPPKSNPYVNAVEQFSATSPVNKCDTKYYHNPNTDVLYEDVIQRREPHNHSYRNMTHIPQDTCHHNNDHMFLQNQCKSGCHDCMHVASQKNVCCSIPPERTSPNSCHSRRQDLTHGCNRNFNHTHLCNSCPPIHSQSHLGDDIHTVLTDLCSTVKLQTEHIVILQKQVEQLLQLQIDSHKYISCSVPVTKASENILNGNSYSPENNVKIKQANRMQNTGKTCENLPVIEENEQRIEKSKVSVGVVTSFKDSTSTNDASGDSHCNCSNKNKSSPKEMLQKPSQEMPAYYAEPPQHDQDIQTRTTKPIHTMKTTRKSHEKPAENKQKSKPVEESFTLNEADLAIDTIAEQAPSPITSIHVDMTEYQSCSSETGSESDCSDNSSDDERPAEPEFGWTFYNNVVGQVNNILKKKETPLIDDEVKRATIDYLRHIGISFTDDMDYNVSKRVTFNAAGSPDRDGPSDGSLHMNGLAMQHLREDQMINGRPDKLQDFMMYNVASGNTNLSFATLRCLERHHLLKQEQYAHYEPGARDSRKKKSKKTKKRSYDQHQQYPNTRKKSSKPNKPSSKILDVEALKQQPKLL